MTTFAFFGELFLKGLFSHKKSLLLRIHLGLIDVLSQVLHTFLRLFDEFPHLLTLPFQHQLERKDITLRQ